MYPLVSVLMTAYNREEFISEAIESVLSSSYPNFELIIVDDASKDNTVAIAKSYEEKDKRIKVYLNDKNLGDYPNRNKAITYAKGEFIMFVDSDDTIVEDGIDYCIKNLLRYPEAGLGMYYPFEAKETFILKSSEAIKSHFFVKQFLIIGPGGTILRKKFLEEINKYPIKYGPANDMYFNLKACSYTNILLLPTLFLNYRKHDGQEINNHYSYLINSYRYLRDALLELPLHLTQQEIKWLSKKNKRRFITNVSRYFIKTYNITKTYKAIKLADFSITDALTGIFH